MTVRRPQGHVLSSPRWLGPAAIVLVTLVCCEQCLAEQQRLGIVTTRPNSGHYVSVDGVYMVPYTDRIPGTDITFQMVPVPAFPGIEPFWIGKHEVSWPEYQEFMLLYEQFNEFEWNELRKVTEDNLEDTVTAPTPLYFLDRFDYTKTPEFTSDAIPPATSMSRFASRQYTKWLSLISDRQYRLPTENEWQHACRAGAKTKWSFGSSPAEASRYCVSLADRRDCPAPMGSKLPNAWGIHDMHGNVSEWVVAKKWLRDHRQLAKSNDPAQQGRKLAVSQMIAKGGDWTKSANDCRVTIRETITEDMWDEEAEFIKSPHWLACYQMHRFGFRLARSYRLQTRAELEMYWGPDHAAITADINTRLRDQGREKIGIVDKQLPTLMHK